MSESREFKLATAKYAATVLARYLISEKQPAIIDRVTSYCKEPADDKLVALYDLLFEGLDSESGNEQTVGPANLVVGETESNGIVDRPNIELGTT
jgi:hypothetical protein